MNESKRLLDRNASGRVEEVTSKEKKKLLQVRNRLVAYLIKFTLSSTNRDEIFDQVRQVGKA